MPPTLMESPLNGWDIVWDEGIREKLNDMREASLPNETGGVILGYIDQKVKSIYVVDVLQAPPDSISSPVDFIRGTEGLYDKIEEVKSYTAGVVDYVGEWHSHPRHTSATPSKADIMLISKLADKLASDGQPALMMIVGEDEISLSVKDATHE
jgi:integrative and conjugative element protein (TIGR02256 family)